MISKVPGWCWGVAWILAFSAGVINVVGILGSKHHAITHLTGTTSLVAISVAKAEWQVLGYLTVLIGAFVFGAMLSGIIVQNVSFELGRRYSVALTLVAVMLTVSVYLLKQGSYFGYLLASCACGLQNAMVTTFSSATIRTSHLSGMFTDLGLYLGHALRGLPVDLLRLRLCFLIITGFACGGIVGAASFAVIAYNTIYISIFISLIAAVLTSNAMRSRYRGSEPRETSS